MWGIGDASDCLASSSLPPGVFISILGWCALGATVWIQNNFDTFFLLLTAGVFPIYSSPPVLSHCYCCARVVWPLLITLRVLPVYSFSARLKRIHGANKERQGYANKSGGKYSSSCTCALLLSGTPLCRQAQGCTHAHAPSCTVLVKVLFTFLFFSTHCFHCDCRVSR